MSSSPPPSGQRESLSPNRDRNDVRNIIRSAKKNQNETGDATVNVTSKRNGNHRGSSQSRSRSRSRAGVEAGAGAGVEAGAGAGAGADSVGTRTGSAALFRLAVTIVGAAVVPLKGSAGFSQQAQENVSVYKKPIAVATAEAEAEAAVLVWTGVVVYNQPVQEYERTHCAVAVQRGNSDKEATCAGIKVEAEAEATTAAAAPAPDSKMTGIQPGGSIVTGAPGRV
ncbi:hypothetical protein BGZ51_002378 [Haplosporangium sp. Z 767]|nr:hypothetical protein BGZ51_002378 [Haplosporangium sp. Z 767]